MSLEIYPGQLVVVQGRSGSGRSSLLLAVAGRMKGLARRGDLRRSEPVDQPGRIAARVSVARISGLIDLEPQLTVGGLDHRTRPDRRRPDRRRRADRTGSFADRLGLVLDPTMLITELSRLDQGRLPSPWPACGPPT